MDQRLRQLLVLPIVQYILLLFFQAVAGALTTWLMDNLEQKQLGKVKEGSLRYVLLLAFCSIGVMLIAPEVVLLLGGKQYSASVFLVPGFVFAVFIQSVTTIFTILLTYSKSVVRIALFTTVIAVFSVLGKVLFLENFGYEELPYINVIAFAILFMFNYYLIKKAGYVNAVNIRNIVLILLIMGVITVSVLKLYNHDSFRYAVLFVYVFVFGLVLTINRKGIMNLIRKRRCTKSV